ncbi:enoyl-CoA delta isomerase 3, peroxisomal [Megalopta genalis]|uniref:enoyl-CoA delta isomerase 3, peroxisomal n=1 Tax=Megalopta genalis TaxID=115081 RepID=UPI003FD20363
MTNQDSSDILYSIKNKILKIVFNRPKKGNCINISMYSKLSQLLHESIQDSNVQVVVLTGTGKFFTTGNDFVSIMANQDPNFSSVENLVTNFSNFVEALITYPKLLIAIVNGPAIGIGATMLPLFDMVYCSDTAYFYTPFTKLGVVAEGCSTYTYPKILGQSKAGDMLYLGYKMNAREAKQYGFVSEVYKHKNLNDVWTYLMKISTLSAESILAIKRLTKKWNEKLLLEVNREESKEILRIFESPEFFERIISVMPRKSNL